MGGYRRVTGAARRGSDAAGHGDVNQQSSTAAEPVRGWRYWLGSILFFQVSKLVKDGSDGTIASEDMLNITNEERADYLGSRLGEIWHAQPAGSRSMWRALFSMFGARYIGVSLLAILASWSKLSAAIFLGQFILFLQDPAAPTHTGILYGAALGTAMLTFAVVESQFMIYSTQLGIRARVSVLSFLYSHMLAVNAADLPPAGQTLNVVSNDAQRLEDAAPFLMFLVLAPLETVTAFAATTFYIGFQPALAGFGTLSALILLLSSNSRLFNRLRRQLVEARDQRTKVLSDMFRSMEVIKLYSWAAPFVDKVLAFRAVEMRVFYKWYGLKGINGGMYWSAVGFMSVAAFFIYVFVLDQPLSTDIVFTSMLLFTSVRENMAWRIPRAFELLAELRVSMHRLESFLAISAREVHPAPASAATTDGADADTVLEIADATLAWHPNRAPVLSGVNVTVRRGELVAVVGSVGSSKTSLLRAVLGHLHLVSGTIRAARVSYAPQSVYVVGGTVRDNILLTSDPSTAATAVVDEARLRRVVDVCQLAPDLARWANGLDTYLGSRAQSASGGQRARLALARALYQRADLYLLDDIFGPLDAKTSAAIFVGLREFLVESKAAAVLVTHHLGAVVQCDAAIYTARGRVLAQGGYQAVVGAAVQHEPEFARMLEEYAMAAGSGAGGRDAGNGDAAPRDVAAAGPPAAGLDGAIDDEDDDDADADEGAETAAAGMDFSLFLQFLKLSGSKWMLTGSVILGVATCAVQAVADWWLAEWASEPTRAGQVDPLHWTVFLALILCVPPVALLSAYGFYVVIIAASRALFARMIQNLVKASPRFFALNPPGRIMNRAVKDASQVDEVLPDAFADVLRLWIYMLTIIVTVVIAVPYVLLAIVPVAGAFWVLRGMYVRSNGQVRRLEALSRSPLYSHLVSTVEGLTTVTALQRERQYTRTFCARVDDNTRALLSFYTVERWLCLRVDALACAIIYTAAGLMVALKPTLALGIASLAQMYILSLVDSLQYNVRKSAEMALQLISVQRMLEYAHDIPLEGDQATAADVHLPADWPSRGVVEFQDVTLTYEGSDRPALSGVSFATQAGESLSLVGRTGSGKSSVLNALFRTAEIAAPSRILIDGVDIARVGLHDLRSRLAIIPQAVFQFHGSVRFNLDPCGVHSDAALWEVLSRVELRDVVAGYDGTLDAEPGFSAGEGQLLQLARVLLRPNVRVLVLDECSSNIDKITEGVLQRTLREQFRECTVITVAHRIETVIDSDKVCVLDQGRVQELGAPAALLADPESKFRKIAEEGMGTEKLARFMAGKADKSE
ncbi:hypothetical protein H9P43_004679 [Blastocladiella emersonii ATCC 22665]|nr:hypothetical protein H9P43_004679 [Blastocladiella emersonii ATCC 22665]